ncbi:UDP-galactopyranose mutase [Rhizobium sp. Td3]|nr:UDP-galactopyranose mutase [Rhizobium sp. Td3]
MERFAKTRQVFFFEEYIPTQHHLAYLEIHPFEGTSVKAVRPRIPDHWTPEDREMALGRLLDDLLELIGCRKPILWFYTPMMFGFARHLDAAAVIYDCMDELANFKLAPSNMKSAEQALMARADVVFTGGISLYEAKRARHDNIHAFPSGVDVPHFRAARGHLVQPHDQIPVPSPRLGYYGVIDERLDLELLEAIALARPDWSFILIGPVVKISPDDLPRHPNIHYLGQKDYDELPSYLFGWDVALMPFALNEATRFISPTKTPEYLAAGCPVVSTPIKDVVRGYGEVPGVFIAGNSDDFLSACEGALRLTESALEWLRPVDDILSRSSWDSTFEAMSFELEKALARPETRDAIFRPKAPVERSERLKAYDYLIVGAGFAGAVLAERLAQGAGKRVLVCDRRPHIGGNAYDHYDAAGILVHKYGPHIFHTNSEEIFSYLSRFTAWRPYEHRVLAQVGDVRVPIPINRTTLNTLYGLDLRDDEAASAFLASRTEPCDAILTSKDVVVSQVGSDLYQTFFEGYTRKQWGLDPSELDRSVTSRIPTRTNLDDRYFLDSFQAMPLEGYTRLFERLLDHHNIEVVLETDFADLKHASLAKHTVFTGPIDEYFGYCFGRLPYRSLEFRHETLDLRRLFPVAVINYPSDKLPYTRITEYKHLTGQVHPKTSISYEFACAEGDPYYPIPRPENHALYKQYEALARQQNDVTFVGRLATYKYYNMDQVVGQALSAFRRLCRIHALSGALDDAVRD